MSMNETAAAIRRLNTRYDVTADSLNNCAERQARGEDVGDEFVNLLKDRHVIQDALKGVAKLKKVKQTVLNELK